MTTRSTVYAIRLVQLACICIAIGLAMWAVGRAFDHATTSHRPTYTTTITKGG